MLKQPALEPALGAHTLADRAREAPAASVPGPLTRLDWVGIVLSAAMFLLLSLVRSAHTIFWSDEIMGWLVLRETSLATLLHSWWTGADSSGIFFYLLGRPWLAIFGATERSLRLFSAAGVATACGLLWACARRYYSIGVVAAIVPLTLAIHQTILWQLSNGRTYGLFLAAIALTAYVFALTDASRPLTTRLLVLTFVAHLLLVGSHILGPFYSAIFFAGLLLRDALEHAFRPRLYLAAAAGWVAFLISYRNLIATAALGKPSFWTNKPHLRDLIVGFTAGDGRLRKAIFLLFVLALLAVLKNRFGARTYSLASREPVTRLTLLVIFFVCVPILFLLSRVTTSVFVDRYLLPIVLGDALLLCELTTQVLDGWSVGVRVRQSAFALMLIALAVIVKRQLPLKSDLYPQRNYTPSLLRLIPPDVPAVITHPGVFAEMVFYQNTHATLLTPVDWPVTLDRSMSPGYVSGTHEMENWKKLGYFANQIESTNAILASNPRFVVIAEEGETVWFFRRVASADRYTIQDLGVHQEAVNLLHLWMVTRR